MMFLDEMQWFPNDEAKAEYKKAFDGMVRRIEAIGISLAHKQFNQTDHGEAVWIARGERDALVTAYDWQRILRIN